MVRSKERTVRGKERANFSSERTVRGAEQFIRGVEPLVRGWNGRTVPRPERFVPQHGASGSSTIPPGSSPNELVRLIKLFDRSADSAGVLGSAAATGADDVRAGCEDVGHGARGFFRRLCVNRFEIFQNGKAGVGLDHRRKLAAFSIKANDFGRARHVHARAAIQSDDIRAASLDKFRRLLGSDAHHGFVERAVSGKIVSERADDAGSARGFGGVNREAEFFKRSLSLDNDRVDARFDERGGLLIERGAGIGFGKIAVGFENCAKRTDVAENETGPLAKSFSRDASAGVVDLAQILGVTMTPEHERAAAERVRDKTIGARFDITALNGENAFGMSDVPHFTAIALLESSEHKLRAHRAVADEAAFEDDFLKRLFHA